MKSSISVIIATKNSGRFLRECLDSVQKQTVAPLEVLIVDANSKDETRQIADEYSFSKFIRQESKGFTGAWNEGIKVSKGEYVAFVDSDDFWAPHKLEWQIEALNGQPNAQGVVGQVRFFLNEGDAAPATMRKDLLHRDFMAEMPGTFLARKYLFEQQGLWPENLEVTGDIDWFIRLKDHSVPIIELPKLVLHKRVHGQNVSYNAALNDTYSNELLRLLHASILRKRARITGK